MDSITIILIAIIFFLVIALIYTWSTKNQAKKTSINSKEKKEKQIKIREENNFKGQLVIEGYPELERLYLRRVKSIDKMVLKNLENLGECTIWDCGIGELIIESCPQIKKLNVKDSLLVDLEELKEKYANLKDFLKEIWFSISEEVQEILMDKLDEEIKTKERKFSDAATNKELKTTEIILGIKNP